MRALAIGVALVGAAPTWASEQDAQAWASLAATAAVAPKLDTTLELHSRYSDDVSRLGQLLVRPSLTYKLPRGWSVTAGYAYVRTRFARTRANDEHRAWQQVGYRLIGDGDGLTVTGRTRVEQRFRADADGVGWRLRQQVRLQLPLAGAARGVAQHETFVGLNTTAWDRHPGIDQIRSFVGISLPVTRNVAVEPGYLNQTVFRIGRDRMNHALAANIVARL